MKSTWCFLSISLAPADLELARTVAAEACPGLRWTETGDWKNPGRRVLSAWLPDCDVWNLSERRAAYGDVRGRILGALQQAGIPYGGNPVRRRVKRGSAGAHEPREKA